MISKQQIKDIRALASRKGRVEAGLFVVEGEKLVNEALSSGYDVVSIFRRDEIGDDNMKRISQLSSPSPVLAVLKIPDNTTELSSIDYQDLSLALDSVKDPGNLGTIIRVVDWFGIKRIFLAEGSVDVYNSKVVQSSMGAIFRVKTSYGSLEGVVRSYLENNLPVYGTFLDAPSIYEHPLANRGLIIFGNESEGISPQISGLISERISIPSYCGDTPTSESLNVASAVSIICAEFRRRV